MPRIGKTALLLELADKLLSRAEQNSDHPIPVIFNLSSWSAQRRPLVEWLVDELHTAYDVPLAIGKTWFENGKLLLFLDELDKVALEHRAKCVQEINAYRSAHGFVPLVVCSRAANYAALPVKLRLHGAIEVKPHSKIASRKLYLSALITSIAAAFVIGFLTGGRVQATPRLRSAAFRRLYGSTIT
ncbi:MAG: hypothetical protein MI924_13370 [Chloroflexales bacterium]|nr:hypothetical protein [Chloroflexales bacterium]